MAKATLPVNFKDDVLNSKMSGKRRYTITQNSDGTYCIEDASTYDQIGSNFGSAQVNATNTAVNAAADAGKIIDSLSTIASNTQSGYMAGALAVKELNQSLGNLNGSIKTIWIETGKSYSFDIGKSGALIFCPRGEWGVMTDYYSPSWTTVKGTIYQNFTIAKSANSYKVTITNKTDFTAMLLIINSGEPK